MDTWAGNAQELHEISVTHGAETADCRCQSCSFCQQAEGHSRVVALQADAAMHAASSGHIVVGHSHGTLTFGPL